MKRSSTDDIGERVVLRSDNGAEIEFRGYVYSETSYFDEETSTLTRLRLFLADGGKHVYSIISGSGVGKIRRHYIMTPGEEFCDISDGRNRLTVPTEMLFASVFGLCGIDPSRAEELRPIFEESLRRASG